MQATNITLDNELIAQSGVQITLADWRRITTTDNSRDLDGKHGRITSPTYARVRIITLEGIVDRMTHPTLSDFDDVQRLEELLWLQWDVSSLTSRTLKLTDPYWRVWTLSVKVRDPIEWQEWFEDMSGSHWRWRVTLESIGSPLYLSDQESVASGIEWSFGGVSLGTTLGVPLSNYIQPLMCLTDGNVPSPARVEILATGTMDAPIKIRNLTSGTLFTIDTSLVSGDLLIIDTERQKVLRNGIDITGLRRRWSVYPTVTGNTQFGIDDLDGAVGVSECSVSIYFREALL